MSQAWKAYKRVLRDYGKGLLATLESSAEVLAGLLFLSLPVTFVVFWPLYRAWCWALSKRL